MELTETHYIMLQKPTVSIAFMQDVSLTLKRLTICYILFAKIILLCSKTWIVLPIEELSRIQNLFSKLYFSGDCLHQFIASDQIVIIFAVRLYVIVYCHRYCLNQHD